MTTANRDHSGIPVKTTNKQTHTMVSIHKLTQREIDCLYWAARGKSSEETALILNIKTSTVITYRAQIKTKLNCITLGQAIYKAMKYGYDI